MRKLKFSTLSLIMIMMVSMLFIACSDEQIEPIIPVQPKYVLPDTMMIISVNNLDTVIQDTVFKQPTVVNINTTYDYLKNDNIINNLYYHISDSIWAEDFNMYMPSTYVRIYSPSLNITNYSFINETIIDEIYNLNDENDISYLEQNIFDVKNDGNGFLTIKQNDTNKNKYLGFINFGINDSTIYEINFMNYKNLVFASLNKNDEASGFYIKENSIVYFDFTNQMSNDYMWSMSATNKVEIKGDNITYYINYDGNRTIYYKMMLYYMY